VKAVDRADILRDVKGINQDIFTILRHWDDSLQHYDGNLDFNVWLDRARAWFATHIDGTFKDQYAPFVDAVSWHNEIWANSQNANEVRERIIASEAAVFVWENEYRNQPEYQDIQLVIGEAAIGNDMPREIALLAIQSGNIVGYHPYTKYVNKVRDPGDWQYLSGRWHYIEQVWGLKPTWAFTEAGPFEGVLDGWKSSKCLGGDRQLYIKAIYDWIQDMQQTPAYQEGRLRGFNLFTSGGGDKWKLYEIDQTGGLMDELATMISLEWKPGTYTPPPPPPPPPIEKDPCKPREGFNRKTTNVIPQDMPLEDAIKVFSQVWQQSKETVSGSYDEAGLGPKALTRTARLLNIPQEKEQEFLDWYALHYPGTVVEFATFPDPEAATPPYEIAVIVDSLPKHKTKTYKTRPLTDITTLTIHHTVSPPSRPIASIAAYHVDSRDWPGIGYHYVINDKGDIYQTNWLESISYHTGVSGYNNNEVSIGIALQDDFTDHPPTQAALDSARWLVEKLKADLGGLEVRRHRDMPGAQTQCPGNTSPDWIDYIAGT
jgi:hypothetical protein